MSWEAIGAIAETLGALAVFASIAVLIVQVRANTRAIEAASVRELHAQVSNSWMEAAYNPYTPDIFAKHMAGEELTYAEIFRIQAINHAMFQNYENAYHLLEAGLIDDGYKEVHERQITNLMARGSLSREFWNNHSLDFVADFRAHVDELIDKVDRTGDT